MNMLLSAFSYSFHVPPAPPSFPSSFSSFAQIGEHPVSLLHYRGFCRGGSGDAILASRLPVSAQAVPARGGLVLAVEVDTKHLHYEREEAKAMLCEFLRSQGFGRIQASRLANRAPLFINHLVSTLARRFRSRYLSGRELTTLEIREVIDPYLESVAEQTDDIAEFLECFPDPPGVRRHGSDGASSAAPGVPAARSTRHERGERGEGVKRAYVQGDVLDERAQPALAFFLSLGLTQEQIPLLIKRFPGVLSYSVENKLRPAVHFFLELGIAPEDVPKLILRWPQIVGCSLEENLRPKVVQLEAWGVKREAWPKLVPMFPRILTTSHDKQASVVQFLRDVLGLKPNDVGKVIMRFPHIMGYSVEGKLVPLVHYLHSIGIPNVGPMITRCPQLFGLSLNSKIQPARAFFLSTGLSPSDAALMMFRFPTIVGLSVDKTLRPKWQALTLSGLDPSEVVRFPQFFGYSLERRIRPRLRAIAAQGLVDWNLNRALTPSDSAFSAECHKRIHEALEHHQRRTIAPHYPSEVQGVEPQRAPLVRSRTRKGDADGLAAVRGENGHLEETGRMGSSNVSESLDLAGEHEGLWRIMGAEQSMGCASGRNEIVGLGILRLAREKEVFEGSESCSRTKLGKKVVLRRSRGEGRSVDAGYTSALFCHGATRSTWRALA